MIKIRKKNKIDNCKYCKKEFDHYTWDTQIFCCKKCSDNHRKVKVHCDVCNKELLKAKSQVDRNKLNYCSRKCYEIRRKEGLTRIKRGTEYFSNLLTNSSCTCGETHTFLLQIHHIDSNPQNNKETNLEIVCANCHIKRHLKQNKDGTFIYNTKYLTNKELLKLL